MNYAGRTNNFNFLKWYVMFHYINQIELYVNITSLTINITEAINIIWINNFFKQTNRKTNLKKQIFDYNIIKFSLMIKADSEIFSSTKTLTQGNPNSKLQINPISSVKKFLKD